jgi:hypothetical protein
MTTNFFSPLSFVEVFAFLDQGSKIWDPGWVKSHDPGSGINIPDPQHCAKLTVAVQESCLCPWSLSWAEEVWQQQSPPHSPPSQTRKMTSQNRSVSIRVKTIIHTRPPPKPHSQER